MEQRNAIARCKKHGATRITVWTNRSGQMFTEQRADFDTLIGWGYRNPCGCLVLPQLIKGTRDESVKCSRTCRSAYGVSCRCACGGDEHGAEHSIEVLQGLRQ